MLGCKRCDHCSAIKVALRKDGHTKLFLRTRAQGRGDRGSQPRSALQAVRACGPAHIPTALPPAMDGVGSPPCDAVLQVHGEGEAKAADDSEPESDDEDEDEDGGDRMDVDEPPASKASSAKAGDKYMAPSEVASHLQLLWQSQTVLVSLLWGRASSKKAGVVGRGDKEGWRPYFWKLLAIPPSRFRPPGRNDDGSLSEHPQNSNIAKVRGPGMDARSASAWIDELWVGVVWCRSWGSTSGSAPSCRARWRRPRLPLEEGRRRQGRSSRARGPSCHS